MLFTHRTHAISRLHMDKISPEACDNYLHYNASTLISQGMFVRIRRNTDSFQAIASRIGYRNYSLWMHGTNAKTTSYDTKARSPYVPVHARGEGRDSCPYTICKCT